MRSVIGLMLCILLAASGCASATGESGTIRQTTGMAAPTAVIPAQSAASFTGDGRTAPGPYFLGRPDAPVLIEEYSDFQ